METMITMSDYIERHGISAELEEVGSNPNMDDMPAGSRHWRVTLNRDGADAMTVPFSQGPGLTEEPTAADVLDCLVSDASSIQSEPDWLAWAQGMGYTSIEDAERARATYQAIERQTEALRAFAPDFDELVYETERL